LPASSFAELLLLKGSLHIPGIGYYLVNSISGRDLNATMGCTVMIAFLLSSVNVLTELIYALANPQFKTQLAGGSSAKSEWRIANEA
jgi:ABC-type dipeptide/oligopeptide/nickel transport system permease component